MPDVVSVPEAAGREALARLLGYGQPAVAPGPVALSAAGRVLFYVAEGGAEDLPELLEWLDWGGVRLDLTAVPDTELTDPPVRWLHPSTVPMQRPGVTQITTADTPNSAGSPNSAKSPNGAGSPNSAGRPDATGGPGSTAATGRTGGGDDGPDGAIGPGGAIGTGSAGGTEGVPGGAPAVEHAAHRPSYPTPGLPEAPELIALLATLAAACHRLAVAAAR